MRELVHTARDLSNVIGEPNGYSLQTDLEGLGFALRWTAGEEFSTQESMSDSFVNGQLSGLSSRITALTRGLKGFALASNYFPGISGETLLASDVLWLEQQRGVGLVLMLIRYYHLGVVFIMLVIPMEIKMPRILRMLMTL